MSVYGEVGVIISSNVSLWVWVSPPALSVKVYSYLLVPGDLQCKPKSTQLPSSPLNIYPAVNICKKEMLNHKQSYWVTVMLH